MSPLSLIGVLFVYFGLLLWVSHKFSAPVRGRWVFLFRAFFPSWKFFDRLGEVPVLSYQVQGVTEWIPYPSLQGRKLWHLFYNPDGNESLATGSLVQQFFAEVEDLDSQNWAQVESLVSCTLIRRTVERALLESVGKISPYQFKVSVCIPGDVVSVEDRLISPVYEEALSC